MGQTGKAVLETEDLLLEMAMSRLRVKLLEMGDPLEEDDLVALIRQEAIMLARVYEDDSEECEKLQERIRTLPGDCILPRVQ